VIIGINLLKTGTKKVCSVFLAAFMVLPVGFEKANALGTREIIETPDGIVQRIKFTKDEFPAVLDFFRAEKDRLEGFGPVMWAYASEPLIASFYFFPGVLDLIFRLFGVKDSYWIFSKVTGKSGIVLDICLFIISSLLFVHDGIPRAERISGRWDYWNVRQITELIDEALNKEPSEHDLKNGYVINEFYIDETSQGEIKIGIMHENGEFICIPARFISRSMGFRGLSYNKFWQKI
jgi:hypothetical protein